MKPVRIFSLRRAAVPVIAALALVALAGCVVAPAYPGYGYGYPGPAYGYGYPGGGYVAVGGGWGWHDGGWHDGGWRH